MSDRSDPHHDEVETVPSVSVDAAAIDLGTQTAQVQVVLPVEYAEDDLVEDDLPCPVVAEDDADGAVDGEPVVELPAPVMVRDVEIVTADSADAATVPAIVRAPEPEIVAAAHSAPEATAEPETDVEPELEAEALPEEDAAPEPVSEAGSVVDVEIEPEIVIDADVEPELEADVEPELETEALPEAEAAPEPETDVVVDAEPAPAVEAESAPDVVAEPEPEAAPPAVSASVSTRPAPAADVPAPVTVRAPQPAVTPAAAVPEAAASVAAPVTAAVPTLRRHHAETAPVTLAAKRAEERDAGRESAGLLTHDRLVEPARLPKAEPSGLWPHLVYTLSGRRINLGDNRRARERKALDARIAVPLAGGARFVAVLSRKGGVGKTTVTTLLGMALADAREDRVIAVDANPDRGTLADRIGGAGGKTVRDLARSRTQVHGFNELSAVVARDRTRLDVLASDTDPRVSDAFSDADYRDVAELAAHYYSIVLTDTGTGIVHSVMDATLSAADALVIVAGLSVDEARLASETLTWLETNGYSELARNSVVVLNTSRPGVPLVRVQEVEEHFRSRARAVVRVPYDALVATGGVISFAELEAPTREASRQLAATVVEGLTADSVTAA